MTATVGRQLRAGRPDHLAPLHAVPAGDLTRTSCCGVRVRVSDVPWPLATGHHRPACDAEVETCGLQQRPAR